MGNPNITPKPWHVMRGDVLDQHGRMVAAVDSFDTEDARLIAASPELLEALQLSVVVIKNMAEPSQSKTVALEMSTAAINKALGK